MMAATAEDVGLASRGRADQKPPRVLFVQHANPAVYPPIEHAALLLADAGCQVQIVGVALVESVRVTEHPRIAVDLRAAHAPGWRQKAAYLEFVGAVLAHVRRFKPDWIYVSDALGAPAAWAAGTLLRVPWVYHEHDALEPGAGRRSAFMWFVNVCRRRCARRARLCVTPSAGRAELLVKSAGRARVQVVWNTPLVRDVAPARVHDHDAGTRLLFHGSIVPARVPESLLYAVAAAPNTVSLRVTGYDPSGGAYLDRLRTLVRELKIDDRVAFAGTQSSRAALMQQGAQCDVGLALLPLQSDSVNERTMLGASNKPFDYMACGLALLVPDLPDWRAVFVDGAFGRACDPGSIDSLVDALRWFDEHREERRLMGERGRRQILDVWNYERGFEPVRDLLFGRVVSAASVRAVAEA